MPLDPLTRTTSPARTSDATIGAIDYLGDEELVRENLSSRTAPIWPN